MKRFVICFCCALLTGTLFGQAPQIQVKPLLGASTGDSPYPMHVQIGYQGQPVNGYLQWQTSPRIRHRIPLSLSSRTQKELVLIWGTSNPRFMLQALGTELEWVPEQGPIARTLVPSPPELAAPVVVIGDVVGGLEVLKQPTFQMTRRTRQGSDSYPLHPVYLKPERVPVNSRWLSGIPVVVLGEGAERMDTGQWQTLFNWLLEGGTLIIPAANVGTALWSTPLKGLFPERAGAPQRINLANSYIELLGFGGRGPSEPVGIIPVRGGAYSPLIFRDTKLLGMSRWIGKGRLVFFEGDLFAPAWRSWYAYNQLWQTLTDGSAFPTLLNPQFDIPTPPLPQRELPSLWWLGGLFTAYWITILIVWRVLRLKRMLVRAPLVLSVLAPLTGIIIAFTLPAPETNRTYLHNRTLTGVEGVNWMVEHGTGIYQMPAGEWRLAWEPGTTVGFMDNSLGRLNGAVTVVQGDPVITEGNANSWCRLHLRTSRVVELGGGIEVKGSWEANAPRLHLLVNRTGLTLKNVHLFSLNGWWKVADRVADGERIEHKGNLPFASSPRVGFNELKGTWLYAELEGVPSVLKTPVTVEEGVVKLYLHLGLEGAP